MMSLLCRFIWVVQSLDKVVDMPVIANDSDCKQWKCLILNRRQRQWHVAPGFAGFAFRAAFSTIAGRCSFSAWSLTRPLRTTTWSWSRQCSSWTRLLQCPFSDRCSFSARSLTRPLCTMTWVMVQTMQFLDKVVALPVVSTTGAVSRQGR